MTQLHNDQNRGTESNDLGDAMFDATSATRRLLKPTRLAEGDRLHVSMTDDLSSFICKAYAIHKRPDGTEVEWTASTMARRSWCTSVTEKVEVIRGVWRLKATDFNALIIKHKWPQDKVNFTSEAATVFNVLIQRLALQEHNARIKAEFKVNGVLPAPPDDWYDHPDLPLSPYQQVAAITAIQQEGCALFMEQGTGKTPVVIRRVMHEAQSFHTRMMFNIIVCPRAVRVNWRNEFKKFATLPGKVAILRGSQLDRVKQLIDAVRQDGTARWSTVICSYETLQRSWEALRMIQWDLGVADESHMFKSKSTNRWEFMQQLRERCRQRMVLTGTPMTNHVSDYYTQLEFLGKGFSGFSTYSKFREYYSKFAQVGDRLKVVGVDISKLPLLQERLTRLSFMITKAEALPSLPKKAYDVIEVQMSPKQRDMYTKLQNDLAIEIERDIAGSKNLNLTANNVLTKLLRLSQITCGYAVTDTQMDDDGLLIAESQEVMLPKNPKLDALIELLVNKGPKEKTIVWTTWVPTIRMISDRLRAHGINHVTYYGQTKEADRERIEHAWNHDPNIKVFIGNPAAGGTGLNLPGYVPKLEGTEFDHGCNADHTVFFACGWSMQQRSQAEDRNHGKHRCRVPVRYTDLVIPGTIDETIRVRVLAKIEAALKVNDVRDIMKQVLYTALQGDD